MNRIYRLVWNRALRVLQVASELVSRSRGGADGACGLKSMPQTALALALAAAITGLPALAHAQSTASGGGGTGSSASAQSSMVGGSGGSAGVNGPTAGSGYQAGGAASTPGTNGGNATNVDVENAGAGGGGGGANGGTSLGASALQGGNGGNGAYNNWGGAGGGGAGGFGAVLAGTGGSLNNQAAITGGTGGTGGWGGWGGGGGGGGGTGLYVSTSTPGTSLILVAAVTGGAGGAGGNSSGGGYNVAAGAGGNSSGAGGASVTGNGGSAGGSGGGGGAGVSFVSSAGGPTTISNGTTVTGGNGGNGGSDGGSNGTGGGDGGSGGAGMNLSGTQITLINVGSIIGGNGGQGGACDEFCTGVAGSSGSGGVGLVVSGGDNTVINSDTISGGLSGDGSTRADAIDLSGGGNTLVLQANSNITGNVVSSSGSTNGGDTLELGGNTNAIGGNSFDASQIGAVGSGVQYQGFTNYSKTGASTWTLTGSTTALTPWVITGGTLAVSSDAALGNDSGTVTLNGGTLEDTASLALFHSLVIGSAGGTLQVDAGNTLFAAGGISGSGSLTQTGTGTLELIGVVDTGGSQTYNGTLAVGGALTLSAPTITLNTVDGFGSGLSLNSSMAYLNGNMSNLLQFTDSGLIQTTNSISIATTGDGQRYGSLVLGGNATLSDSGAGNIVLQNGASGGFDLTVQTGGQITFGGSVDVLGLNARGGAFSAASLIIGGTGLSIQTTAGAITQGGAYSVVGTSSFNAGSSNITLTNAGNVFTGAVSLTGNNASLTNSVATVLGASQIAGALTVSSAGPLNQNGGIIAASLGGSSLGDTTLTNPGNAIATLGNFSASGNFSLTDDVALTVSGTLSASNVILDDTHTATVTGTITAGSITNAQGTLQVGNGGTAGSLSGNALNQGSLVFDRSDVVTFGNTISGAGSLTQNGSGTLILDGVNSYTGTTTVQAGTLEIGDASHASASISSNVSVASGASLSGHGTIIGNVALASGSQLAPGGSIGTLTVNGNLTAAQGTVLNFQFGAPGANFQTAGTGDSVNVTGNLELDGATLNVTNAGSFGDGVYNLFTYGGSLTESNGGISLGSTPTGSALTIQNLTASNQINLLNTTGMTLDFWNGNGLASATQSGGGSGTWTTASSNWTNATGSVSAPMQPQPGFAIFSGAAGTVTIDDSAGNVSATGLQFASNGYTLTGDTLTLVGSNGAAPVIRVGDGTTSGAAYSATIANVIAGSDGLIKSDLGTLVLTGANTYTGGTTISAGTLQIGNGGTNGSVLGNIVNDGTLAFDRSDAVTFAGNVSGIGSLTQNGTGTLILTGTNTYTGGTIIQTGTLQGNSTSLQGNVTDNATLVFNQTSTGTFAGVISGTGALIQNGAGTLILTGANTYSGGTAVSAGTLQGDSSSLQGAIADNATVVFNQSADGTFGGDISGNGALVKTGTGTLILDGVSTFTGNTTVQAGTLEVGDSDTPSALLGGNVQVASNATLRGHGSIGGSVINDGTLWPGGSIGTLTVQGNYTQNADGTLIIDVAPNGQSDQLVVNGKAVLGGTLNLLEQSGTWQPRTNYTILTASGGLSGQFASITSNLAFLTPALNYGANGLDLSLERNDINFVTAALTPNERAVATVANTLGFSNAVYNALVTLSAPQAAQAFNQLSGEIYASDRTAVVDDDRYVRDAINNHLLGLDNSANGQSAQSGDGVTAWTSGWGHWGNHDGDGNASTLQANGSGLLIGADMSLASNSHLGAVIGSGQSTARIDTLDDSSHVIDQHFGFYGSTQLSAFQLQAATIYGWERVDTNRSIDVGSLSDTASSSYHANTTQAYIDGSYALTLGHTTLSPFINLAYEQLHTPQIQENGSTADLNIAGQSSTQTYGTLGVRGTYALDANGDLYLHASAGWQHAWGDTDANITARFASGGGTFDIAGLPVASNAGAINAGFSFRPSSNVTIDATYSGQFASHAKDQAARLSATLNF
jgi:fibronectin-binding autotransporter adhesin